MSYWVYLVDRTAEPWCSYGKAPGEFVPDYPGDGPCPEPCYPAVTVERHAEGGTYAAGGIDEAELNITYNYGRHFAPAWEHATGEPLAERGGALPQMLHGKRAGDVLPFLKRAVAYLGTERDPDYWAATPGNAGYALNILLHWAEQHPDAVFRVS